MSGRFFKVIFLCLLLFACGDDGGAPEGEGASVTITEWVVPYPDSRPRDPFAVSSEKVWFVGQRTGYLAWFNPETEEFTQIALPEGSGPHNIIVDSDGVAWFSGNLNGYIGKVAPDGSFEEIPSPEEIYDPHTLIDDGRGHIWFTAQGANYIGELDKEAFTQTGYHVQTPNARPYGITVAPDGVVWVALFGTNKLAMIDPAVMEIVEITLPRAGARPRRLASDSDGLIWYVDYAEGFLGRYDPEDEEFSEWPMPSGGSAQPYGMAIDKKDRIWFVEVGPKPNRFVGYDPDMQEFFSVTEIESGGGAVRHMHYHGPTNTIWFGTDANTLGRAELPD